MPTKTKVNRHKKVRAAQLALCGIPSDYYQCTLTSYTGPRQHRDRVKKYISHLHRFYKEGLSFCFFGENNSGKTTLAMILAKAFLINGYRVRATDLRSVTDMYCNWEEPGSKEDFIHNVQNVDFLVIDDLNKEFHNRMTHAVLDAVLRHRSNNHLPFAVTTNASVDQLEELYGPSIVALLERRAVMLEFQRDLKNADALVDKNLKLLDSI